jgi:hypothetical protein
MPAVVAKLQRCGKTNCRCFRTNDLHGPYFHLVSFVRKTAEGKKIYRWDYLGRNREIIISKLQETAAGLSVPDAQELIDKLEAAARDWAHKQPRREILESKDPRAYPHEELPTDNDDEPEES